MTKGSMAYDIKIVLIGITIAERALKDRKALLHHCSKAFKM